MPTEQLKLSYAEAANAALRRALTEWPETLMFGEDVALPGGVFGVTKGLRQQFGERVFDTPISETALLGAAVGAALMGRRPIVEVMWMDFSLVALDQLINQAANVRYLSQGRQGAPLTVRTQQGSQPGACAQHSQSLEAILAHVPGLRLCVQATAQDAHDLLLAGIACDDPTVVIENRNLYFTGKQEVTVGGAVGTIGGALVRRPGTDVTIVAWGSMTLQALEAAQGLQAGGISAEVIDARWLNPFDYACVIASLAKTGRLVIAHEANVTGGFSAQIVAEIAGSGLRLKAPPVRVGAPDVRLPAAPGLLASVMPDAGAVERAVRAIIAGGVPA